jgi:2-polyprenyl-3-methyl-5-hydroxy-6-metoxy-1,4-benzoquinol methylase
MKCRVGIATIRHFHFLDLRVCPLPCCDGPQAPPKPMGWLMKNASFWDKAADKYATDPISDMAGYEATRDHMRALLQPHHRVLELGCGTGTTALELAGEVASYTATDVSARMIEIARAKLSDDTPDTLTFMVGDADEVTKGTCDVILALNLLHLLPSPQEVLAQVFQMLPPGGLFISKTPLLRDGAWFLPWIIPVMRAVGKAPYVRCLRDAELRDLLEQTGFELTETLIQAGTVPRLFCVARKP